MIPTLHTERLTLIPPDVDCFDAYHAFYSDPQASSAYGGPLSIEQIWARLKADIGSWQMLGFGVWVIQQKSDGALLGTCGFWQGREWPRELTWWLLPQARGQGLAHEASKAAIEHALDVFKWPCVETYMNDDNHPARKLVESLGGVCVNRKAFSDGLTRNIYRLSNK